MTLIVTSLCIVKSANSAYGAAAGLPHVLVQGANACAANELLAGIQAIFTSENSLFTQYSH